MISLTKAFTFLVALESAAAFAPSLSAKKSHVQLKEASSDDVVDAGTRQARIMTPLASVMAAVSPLGGLVSPANAAPSASAFEANMRKNFPGALTNSAIALRVSAALRDRGYAPANTLFGSSLCSDEINDTAESLVGDFQNKLGTDGVFNLGGLGGLPFVGISGMGAFIHHVPVNGKISSYLVLMLVFQTRVLLDRLNV